MKFRENHGPWSKSDSGKPWKFWRSEDGRYGIWETASDWRGECPPIYWVGLINDPTGKDRENGVTWLPDAASFPSAVEVAEAWE